MAVPLAARIAAQAMRSAKKDMSKQMAQIQKQVQSEIDKGLKDFGSSLKVDAEVLGMDELKKDLKDVRNGIAVTFEGDVKDKITDLPLIDTGLLKKSIISETGDS